jgi:uncharacterized protein
MVHIKSYYLYLLLLLFALACGEKKDTGFTLEKIPDPMHGGHVSYVSNPDHLIRPETEAALNEQMQQLDQSGIAQVAIVLLNTVGDKVPKDVAHDLFRLWKPGRKGKDNGLVVLLVNDQHRIEFETGYGLEGDLPDVICFRIQQSEMLPSFKQNNIDGGMLKGMTALVNVLQPQTDTSIAAVENSTVSADTSSAAIMKAGDIGSDTEETYSPPEVAVEQDSYEGPGVGSAILYVLYALFATIFVVKPGIVKKNKDLPQLFKATTWHKIWVYALPFVLLILITLPGFYHWWMLLLIMYFNLLAYLTYRAFTINKKAGILLQGFDRHVQYETLNLAHANSWVSAIAFPVPLLAYSRWHIARMNKLRYDPFDCESCHRPMQLLKKGKRKEMLEPVQAAEDKVGSVIYDVWYCKHCEDKKVLGYRNLRTDATNCPSCNALTFVAGSSRVIIRATTSHEGKGIQHYLCKNCHYTKEETYVIAKLSSGGSSGSSSGSSGSSSSSGGWGGGSSGGGGAGSSW